jgi:hypothetical protein
MADVDIEPIELSDVLQLDEAVARSTGSEGYGVTDGGFVPKPFARILTEKLALARSLLGSDLDLTSGSVVRKLLEISALEDARTWAALTRIYDDQFVTSASGQALGQLGAELGVPRPFLEASGTVELTFQPPPATPDAPQLDKLEIPAGARLMTAGGHHVATVGVTLLSKAKPKRIVSVVAFYPGPKQNLDPAQTDATGGQPMKIDRWNPEDRKLDWNGATPGLLQVAKNAALPAEAVVSIAHTQPLTGGELMWSDARYRALLVRAPRTLWSAEGIQLAASLVPGVRQAAVLDDLGGLDVDLPLFGQFRFAEALFADGRDLVSPHFVDLLIAPSLSAIPGSGPTSLRAEVAAAIEGLRPIGIGINIREADQVFVAIKASIAVEGLPIPKSPGAQLTSPVANELKQRLLGRVAAYVSGLRFGQPVRYAEVMWALMNEPGVTDVSELQLLRFPAFKPEHAQSNGYQPLGMGTNVDVGATQIAIAVNDDTQLILV